jgi:hypothetical protein
MYSTKPREHLVECGPLSPTSQNLREDLDFMFLGALGFLDVMRVNLEEGETDPREGPRDELRKVQTILHEMGKLEAKVLVRYGDQGCHGEPDVDGESDDDSTGGGGDDLNIFS